MMEQHVIASGGAVSPRRYLQQGQVKHCDGFCVAILHGSPAGTEYLLKCREDHLMDYVLESLRSKHESVEAALGDAFNRMDETLVQENRAEAQASSGPFRDDLLWRTRDNSCVVLVREGMVYCMGYGEGRVVLCRAGKDYNIFLHGAAISCMRIFLDYSKEHHFHYFRKESLSVEDDFLFLGSEVIWRYVLCEECGGLSPAFFTRVKAFGLEEAAKQIIGVQRDDPKVLIAIPLVSSLRDREFDHVEVESDDEGLGPLLPLIDGEQIPRARTALGFSMFGFPPIVEKGPEGVNDWICKRSLMTSYLRGEAACCTIVMQLGNLSNWYISGEDDAIAMCLNKDVHFLPPGSVVIASSRCSRFKVASLLLAVRPEPGMETNFFFQNCLSEASKHGIKYVALPALPCGKNSFDAEREQAVAVIDTLVSSGRSFEEIHLFFRDPRAFTIWTNEFLSTCYDPYMIEYRSKRVSESRSSSA